MANEWQGDPRANQMNFWWVNQNQTYRQEIRGGYMWSPKRNRDDSRNHFYDNMRIAAPGDLVFSFVDARIIAIGEIRSIAYECPRPTEFGRLGEQWSEIGWRVDVNYTRLERQIRPKDFIDLLRPHLPVAYGPLTKDGNGLQNVYLAAVPDPMAVVLIRLIGDEAVVLSKLTSRERDGTDFIVPLHVKDGWEDYQEHTIRSARDISETQRDALIKARRGQGIFREQVCQIEHHCRITRIANPKYLIASHIKPWRHSKNEERLDGENGLLLCPNIDLLFDRGLISFDDTGDVLIAPVADGNVLQKMMVTVRKRMNVGGFSTGQKKYLEFHRAEIFLQTTG